MDCRLDLNGKFWTRLEIEGPPKKHPKRGQKTPKTWGVARVFDILRLNTKETGFLIFAHFLTPFFWCFFWLFLFFHVFSFFFIFLRFFWYFWHFWTCEKTRFLIKYFMQCFVKKMCVILKCLKIKFMLQEDRKIWLNTILINVQKIHFSIITDLQNIYLNPIFHKCFIKFKINIVCKMFNKI